MGLVVHWGPWFWVPNRQSFESPKVRVPRAISDPCQPNPCRNGGACVIHQGRATCRLVNLSDRHLSMFNYKTTVCYCKILKKMLVFAWLIWWQLYVFCRCVSGQAIAYTGDTCEKQHFDGGILGVLIGGVAGTVALIVAIIAVIYRQN